MNADKVTRWLTLGANVGVLIGIFFLAVELRQNNDLLQSQVSISYVGMRTGMLNALWQNDETLKTIVKAKEGKDLSPLELQRLQILYRSAFANWEWEYEQYKKGILEISDQPPELRFRAAVNYYPLMRESWGVHKRVLTPEFVQYMEENVLN